MIDVFFFSPIKGSKDKFCQIKGEKKAILLEKHIKTFNIRNEYTSIFNIYYAIQQI